MTGAAASAARVAALRANLAAVRERIVGAAQAAGRDPAALRLVAVSKTWPASDVAALVGLGLVDFAENREQEATPKAAQVPELLGDRELLDGRELLGDRELAHREVAPVWHFVGQLQTNKAAAVARFAGVVQSVDRARLVTALSRAVTSESVRPGGLAVCLQVSLDPTSGGGGGRGGVDPSQVVALADAVANSSGLRLVGVMGVAPREESARRAFARLREVSERLVKDHPQATVISAGMSGDLEDAVAEGATHLRIGTALFGERASVP